MSNLKTYNGEDFLLTQIGPECSRLYVAVIKIAPYSIPMTGADVTRFLKIPWMHRIISLKIFQTDAAHASNSDAWECTFKRDQGSCMHPHFQEKLFQDLALAKDYMAEQFGESFEYESSVWALVLSGTNTNIMEVMIYVQKCEP